MSVTPISPTREPTRTVEDYQHPEWCDLAHCQPIGGIHVPAEGWHFSTPVIWGVQTEEARFSVQLTRIDDICDGKNHATTRLRVSLRQWAWEDVGRVEADVDAEDARMLAAMLTRYADLADRGTASASSSTPRTCRSAAETTRDDARCGPKSTRRHTPNARRSNGRFDLDQSVP